MDQVFVRAMVELAHGRGKQTIAEFVEDEATLQLLDDLGVDYAQGYHIGRPALRQPSVAAAPPLTGAAADLERAAAG